MERKKLSFLRTFRISVPPIFTLIKKMEGYMINRKTKNLVSMLAIVLSLFLAVAVTSPAQAVRGFQIASSEEDLELIRRESAVSSSIQTQLEDVMKQYYEKNAFVVDVKVHLGRIVSSQDESGSDSSQNDMEQSLPGLPARFSDEKSKKVEQFIYDKMVFTNDYKVRFMEILVLLDDKAFKEKDIGFVKSVLGVRSGFDETRGDTLNIKMLSFPAPAVTEQENAAKADAAKQTAAAAAEKAAKNSTANYYGIIIGLICLLILLQIAALLKKSEVRPAAVPLLPEKKVSPAEPQAALSFSNASPTDKKAIISVDASGKQQPAAVEQKEERKDLFYELRQLMVTTLVGNPGLSSEIFKQWVEADKDTGIYQTAAFFKATDSHLTELIAEFMSTEHKAKIDFAMGQMVSVDQEGIIEIFKKFREDFQKQQYLKNIQNNGRVDESKDMFQFLKQLDAHQIFYVIKDEEVGIIAVVLAQLLPEVANEVINELPQEKRDRIPIEMGKLKKIPLAVYRDISNRLSKKAVEAGQMKYVTTDGVDALLKMLEEASAEQEKQLLDNIREQDIALANEVRKFYLPFDEITKLPDKYLTDIVRSLDRDVIIKALVNAPEEIKTKIVNNLGPRVKIIVSEALKTTEDIPLEDIYNSRREITRKISALAKSGKIDLVKLSS